MRPTRRLLAALLPGALLALATVDVAWLIGPAWAYLLVVFALAAHDWRLVRREPSVQVACELPRRCRLREPVPVSYRIHNPGARALQLSLLDERAPELGGDLALGPLRVQPGQTLTLERNWTAERRGLLPLGPIHALGSSPLGLFERRSESRRDARELRVLPNPGLGSGSLLGPDAELGPRPQRVRGAGLELDSLRPYTEGDDPRHVDWRASARAQQLIVRSFREERNQALIIAVDAGRMMAARAAGLCKLDHALNTALSLAQAAFTHGDRVGFAAFDAAVRCWVPVHEPRRGLALLQDATLPLEARPLESSFRALTELLERSHKKRSLIVILSDFVEAADALELTGYLARLGRRHVVLLVALRDPALSELDDPQPQLDEPALYRRLVLQDLAAERDLVLRRLTRAGVHTLDLRPEQARAPVLARYLALRAAL